MLKIHSIFTITCVAMLTLNPANAAVQKPAAAKMSVGQSVLPTQQVKVTDTYTSAGKNSDLDGIISSTGKKNVGKVLQLKNLTTLEKADSGVVVGPVNLKTNVAGGNLLSMYGPERLRLIGMPVPEVVHIELLRGDYDSCRTLGKCYNKTTGVCEDCKDVDPNCTYSVGSVSTKNCGVFAVYNGKGCEIKAGNMQCITNGAKNGVLPFCFLYDVLPQTKSACLRLKGAEYVAASNLCVIKNVQHACSPVVNNGGNDGLGDGNNPNGGVNETPAESPVPQSLAPEFDENAFAEFEKIVKGGQVIDDVANREDCVSRYCSWDGNKCVVPKYAIQVGAGCKCYQDWTKQVQKSSNGWQCELITDFKNTATRRFAPTKKWPDDWRNACDKDYVLIKTKIKGADYYMCANIEERDVEPARFSTAYIPSLVKGGEPATKTECQKTGCAWDANNNMCYVEGLVYSYNPQYSHAPFDGDAETNTHLGCVSAKDFSYYDMLKGQNWDYQLESDGVWRRRDVDTRNYVNQWYLREDYYYITNPIDCFIRNLTWDSATNTCMPRTYTALDGTEYVAYSMLREDAAPSIYIKPTQAGCYCPPNTHLVGEDCTPNQGYVMAIRHFKPSQPANDLGNWTPSSKREWHAVRPESYDHARLSRLLPEIEKSDCLQKGCYYYNYYKSEDHFDFHAGQLWGDVTISYDGICMTPLNGYYDDATGVCKSDEPAKTTPVNDNGTNGFGIIGYKYPDLRKIETSEMPRGKNCNDIKCYIGKKMWSSTYSGTCYEPVNGHYDSSQKECVCDAGYHLVPGTFETDGYTCEPDGVEPIETTADLQTNVKINLTNRNWQPRHPLDHKPTIATKCAGYFANYLANCPFGWEYDDTYSRQSTQYGGYSDERDDACKPIGDRWDINFKVWYDRKHSKFVVTEETRYVSPEHLAPYMTPEQCSRLNCSWWRGGGGQYTGGCTVPRGQTFVPNVGCMDSDTAAQEYGFEVQPYYSSEFPPDYL